ncbi:MAG: hypothetical protein NZ893_02255, partial [Candidatus Aenigmarchaeota archaeon]|nr:hypothetical protein [Candidatus Aenigmarchaeota archaeon]
MDFEVKQIVETKDSQKESAIEKKEKTVPLFVKLERYKDILGILNDMKSIIFFVKNAITVQKQIEVLIEENKKLLAESIAKMDEKIMILEKELIRPGLHETRVEVKEEKKDLDKTLEEIKQQIESLK